MSLYSVYATTTDLAAFLAISESDLPGDSTRLLTRASELIQQGMLNNYDGNNLDHVEAAKLATCAQVEYWKDMMGESLSISGPIQSFSNGDVTMNFGNSLGRKSQICPRARSFLNQQGLLYRGV